MSLVPLCSALISGMERSAQYCEAEGAGGGMYVCLVKCLFL